MKRLPLPEFMARTALADQVHVARMHADNVGIILGKTDKHLGRVSKLHRARSQVLYAALNAQGYFR